jgi:phenylacetic acid degradation operon negative regulatory protein
MRLTAKRAVLELMSVLDPQPVPASGLIEACGLLGITANSVRVTLARLSADSTIETTARGMYRLQPEAAALARASAEWRTAERKIRPWTGAWVMVHTGGLGRSDRGTLRRRERAMQLAGLRELVRGLAIRPDNLLGGAPEVRHRLLTLGMEEAALVSCATFADPRDDTRARALWPSAELSAAYRTMTARLRRWLDRRGRRDARTIARETFLLGSEVLRQLVFDPLLPEPLVDVEARRTLVKTMVEFDLAGRCGWQEVFGDHDVLILPP